MEMLVVGHNHRKHLNASGLRSAHRITPAKRGSVWYKAQERPKELDCAFRRLLNATPLGKMYPNLSRPTSGLLLVQLLQLQC
jgi:hypothetical protein